jgi:hypothetical protein
MSQLKSITLFLGETISNVLLEIVSPKKEIRQNNK